MPQDEEIITREVIETPKKYEEIEYKGQPARRYPDGAIRNERGQLLAMPEKIADYRITTETASAMGKRRKEKILEAIEQGIMDITKAESPAQSDWVHCEKTRGSGHARHGPGWK